MTGVDSAVRSAEVLLGTSLISEEEVEDLLEGLLSDGASQETSERSRVGTGIKSVDDALDGGLKGGSVVGVWSEPLGGGSELCRALLVSCLLDHPDSTVAVIDTTGNFDVLGVYKIILSKLTADAQVHNGVQRALELEAGASVEDVAAQLLDHVKIMRVFDFVGVREAVSEIRDGLEGRAKTDSTEQNESKESAKAIEAQQEEFPTKTEQIPRPKRTIVADSEDEDEDEDDEDEMLFDDPEPMAEPTPSAQNAAAEMPTLDQAATPPAPTFHSLSHPNPSTKLILIDNLSHILSPPLKNNSTNTTHLITTFLHALANLTRTHNLHTIITNPATHPRQTSPTRQQDHPPPGQAAPPQQQKRYVPPPPPSIFASQTLQPGLLGVHGSYVDVGLLVGRIPRRTIDARVLYKDLGSREGRNGYAQGKVPRGVEMVSVVEVMCDRWEGRVGGWGCFGVVEGGMRAV